MADSAISVHPQFVVDEHGEPKAVQLSVAEFEALMELIEDYTDGLALDQAIETAEGFTDAEEVFARLRAKGKLCATESASRTGSNASLKSFPPTTSGRSTRR